MGGRDLIRVGDGEQVRSGRGGGGGGSQGLFLCVIAGQQCVTLGSVNFSVDTNQQAFTLLAVEVGTPIGGGAQAQGVDWSVAQQACTAKSAV